jgi:hypothetical protein
MERQHVPVPVASGNKTTTPTNPSLEKLENDSSKKIRSHPSLENLKMIRPRPSLEKLGNVSSKSGET